jgi:hypothetical protein
VRIITRYKKRGMNMGKTRQASFLYLAAALLLTTCDVFGPSLEETLDYNRGIYPVTTWDELRTAVGDVPDGITIVVAKDLTADSEITIPNGKNIHIAAYRDKTVTIRRSTSPSDYTSRFFLIPLNATIESLTLGDSKHGGTLILDGGAKNTIPMTATDALIRVQSDSITIEAGAVLQNNSGGGVYGGAVYTSGTFTMNGGIIRDNTANSGGGVCASTFIMNGGTIGPNNAAATTGGGVYVDTTGSFTMHGGTISGNTVSAGPGGGVRADTSFTKTGGIIYGKDGGSNRNMAISDASGHAVFSSYLGGGYRDTTAGPAVILEGGPTWSGGLEGP